MPHIEILVRETLRAIDTCTSRPVSVEEIATLNHEVLDHSMESAAFIALRLAQMILRLARAELSEVLGCARDDVCENFHFDAA